MSERKVKILMAEDSTLTQKAIKFMLEKNGYDVIAHCSNGKEAVAEYKNQKPDVVLMDLAMPVMDGITATKKIIAFDKKAKIIAVSALYSQKIRNEAFQAGASEYIIKPFEVSEIINAIEGCLEHEVIDG